ncbi:hypothetical protein JEQ12_007131 [Ovis aries]|uniref:Transforming acidic coiled-coil-containing protein C-terminal domain-containing protein n=1 Tax=Ovis aries TaxID=9940 RepID=A0A836CTN0_SHEEP|nr:hypothetical protein JEQ12_007131 [Ovis aries]
MSLHIFSDESVTGDKSAENCDFLFSPPELTGRSSVLRLSQKENVPPKSTDKAVKEPRAAGLAPCDLGPGAPLLPVGPIVDVLQYSQKNLDSAVEATQKENEVMEESQRQKELAKAEMQKVLKEKVQLMADLHSMEKSFSDLFKRFEKQKENKESLKKCVED